MRSSVERAFFEIRFEALRLTRANPDVFSATSSASSRAGVSDVDSPAEKSVLAAGLITLGAALCGFIEAPGRDGDPLWSHGWEVDGGPPLSIMAAEADVDVDDSRSLGRGAIVLVRAWLNSLVCGGPSTWRALPVEQMHEAVPLRFMAAEDPVRHRAIDDSDIDLLVKARFRFRPDTAGRVDVGVIAQAMRRLVGLPVADSSSLQVAPLADDEHPRSQSAPGMVGLEATFRRSDFTERADGVRLCRCGVPRGGAEEHVHLRPGVSCKFHIRLPLEVRARLQASLRRHILKPAAALEKHHCAQLMAALLPDNKSVPYSMRGLLEAAMWLERFPAIGRDFPEQLDVDVELPWPERERRVETRTAFLYTFVGLEEEADACAADNVALSGRVLTVGTPILCKIDTHPGPLALLATLNSSLVRARMSSLPKAAGASSRRCPSRFAPGIDSVRNQPDDSCAAGFWRHIETNDGVLNADDLVVCAKAHQQTLRQLLSAPTAFCRGLPQIPLPPHVVHVGEDLSVSDSHASSATPTLELRHVPGARAYRVECLRYAVMPARHALAELNTTSQPSLLVLLVRPPDVCRIGDRLRVHVKGLCPGRYVFRVIARSEDGLAAYSHISTAGWFIPDVAVQVTRLRQLDSLLARCKQQARPCAEDLKRLEELVQLARDAAVGDDHASLLQARNLCEEFRSVVAAEPITLEVAMQQLQAQLYSPSKIGLERSVRQALQHGADKSCA
eukprot:CAMPEP_0170217498 /NCGR_PEP_ID=MMETSP0116_2-20130129/8414_1 /TAXON_ID=400756 /ORGANISM="Durinskia baltica, Strain CSIRO CS-38" /LENGTH=730 /DNA_ID=CAMNT_0010468131 /DNA_START=170 /DNA_END=2358 /DNA_ORIENTATION=-